MKDITKNMFKYSIETAIVYLIVGVLLLFVSDKILILTSQIIGGILLIFGLIPVFTYFASSNKQYIQGELIIGIFLVISGLVMIFNPTLIGSMIPIIIGIFMIFSALSKIKYSLYLKDNKVDKYLVSLVFSIITLLVGIFIIFNPWQTTNIFFKIIGSIIIFYAICAVVETIFIKKKVNNTVDQIKEATILAEKETVIVDEK